MCKGNNIVSLSLSLYSPGLNVCCVFCSYAWTHRTHPAHTNQSGGQHSHHWGQHTTAIWQLQIVCGRPAYTALHNSGINKSTDCCEHWACTAATPLSTHKVLLINLCGTSQLGTTVCAPKQAYAWVIRTWAAQVTGMPRSLDDSLDSLILKVVICKLSEFNNECSNQ